jgi:hypothetical protein
VVNLYDQEGVLGPADVTLVGASGGKVAGSVVFNAAGDGFTFIRTGGPLPPDTYTVTLRSAADGFTTPTGVLLDGNGDGTPGDDYSTSFSVAAPAAAAVVISAPDFARGAGQAVDLSAGGLPLYLSDGGNVTSLSLTVLYDPALLQLTGAVPGADVPAGATVNLDTSTSGRAVLHFSNPAALASGPWSSSASWPRCRIMLPIGRSISST